MKKRKKLFILLLCLTLVFSIFGAPAHALSGRLTVNYDFDGVTFDVFRVAAEDSDGNWQVTEAFATYQINFDTAEFRDIAATLAGYVMRDHLTPDISQKVVDGQCVFNNLEKGLYFVIGEEVEKDGCTYMAVPVLIEVCDANMTVDIKYDSIPDADEPEYVSCSVEKIWVGENVHPENITVQLIKDGMVEQERVLNEENHWQYTWEHLDASHSWQVIEKEVPENYEVSITQDNLRFKIVNTQNTPPQKNDESTLTVHKIWIDDKAENRPESIRVHLLKNGKFHEAVELTETMQWTYTWDNLDADDEWTVIEVDIPKGYKVSYKIDGAVTHIVNTKSEEDTKDPEKNPEKTEFQESLTVRKVWSNDEESLENRPDSIRVTLYDGDKAVDTVWLGEWNYWRYTWRDLDAEGNWSVLEENIPEHYTPSYSKEKNVVTITNTAALIYTGQINWPVWTLLGVGLMMIFAGLVVLMRKEKREDD